jgi:hypothetical protein
LVVLEKITNDKLCLSQNYLLTRLKIPSLKPPLKSHFL